MATTSIAELFGLHAQRRIRSADDEEVYTLVTDAACYLATAGHLAEAEDVLRALWAMGWPHTGNVWLHDQAFTVLWYAAGAFPAALPFTPQPLGRIERNHRKYMSVASWGLPLAKSASETLTGLDLFRRSFALATLNQSPDSLIAAANELRALDGLERYLADPSVVRDYMWERAHCLAAELAARNGRLRSAETHARAWARHVVRADRVIFETMASNRHVAPLLLDGILAGSLRVSHDAAQRHRATLLDALAYRRAHGREHWHRAWSWRRLVQELSKQIIRLDREHNPDFVEPTHSLWHPPASETAIAATEARLAVQLPADYRAFLRVANGFAGETWQMPALLPIEQIDYARNGLDAQALDSLHLFVGEDLVPHVEHSIAISDPDQIEFVLLIPPTDARDTWQTWWVAWKYPPVMIHPDFRHYMERVLHDMRR